MLPNSKQIKVLPGVYQIKVPSPYIAQEYFNIYLIKDGRYNILIDTGYYAPKVLSELESELKVNGLEFGDISHIIITHTHFDHCGLAGKLKESSGAELILHETESEIIKNRWINFDNFMNQVKSRFHQHGASINELTSFLKVLKSQKGYVIPAFPDKMVKGNENLSFNSFKLKVLLTPGHSTGHICLYEPEKKLLFSGDHIMAEGIPPTSYLPGYSENPLGDFINSFHIFNTLEADMVLPGHGPVFNGLNERIQQMLHQINQHQLDVINVLGNEPKNAYEIARDILKSGVQNQEWNKVSSVKKVMTLLETLGHLQLLVSDGRAKKSTKDDMIFYSMAI